MTGAATVFKRWLPLLAYMCGLFCCLDTWTDEDGGRIPPDSVSECGEYRDCCLSSRFQVTHILVQHTRTDLSLFL